MTHVLIQNQGSDTYHIAATDKDSKHLDRVVLFRSCYLACDVVNGIKETITNYRTYQDFYRLDATELQLVIDAIEAMAKFDN